MIDFRRPIPPSPDASAALLEAFAERDIEWHPEPRGPRAGPGRNVALLRDGGELPYDLFLAVPVHRAPAVVVEAGLTKDGWIPVDPLTFETSYPGVYAMGDVAAVGTPRPASSPRVTRRSPPSHRRAHPRRRRAPLSTAVGDLLSRIRRRPGRAGRRHLFGDQRSGELVGPSSLGGGQGRVRLQPHQALVRTRLAEHRRPGLDSSGSGVLVVGDVTAHVTGLPDSSCCCMAMWTMKRVGAAPCQWFSPGSKKTRYPGRITSTGQSSRWHSPMPSVT